MSGDRCHLLCLDLELAEGLRVERLTEEEAAAAAARAASFGDPTRLILAAALKQGGEMCVCDLAWIAERAENLVSHHLRRLRTDGMVSSRREGKMVLYRVTSQGEQLLEAVTEPAARQA